MSVAPTTELKNVSQPTVDVNVEVKAIESRIKTDDSPNNVVDIKDQLAKTQQQVEQLTAKMNQQGTRGQQKGTGGLGLGSSYVQQQLREQDSMSSLSVHINQDAQNLMECTRRWLDDQAKNEDEMDMSDLIDLTMFLMKTAQGIMSNQKKYKEGVYKKKLVLSVMKHYINNTGFLDQYMSKEVQQFALKVVLPKVIDTSIEIAVGKVALGKMMKTTSATCKQLWC
jgi:hypothetical protein